MKVKLALPSVGLILLVGAGCAQKEIVPDETIAVSKVKPLPLIVTKSDIGDYSGGIVLTKGAALPKGPVEVKGITLQSTKFDIPVVINSQVLRWVDYFTGRGRELFEVYLHRSEYFIPYLQRMLKKNEMPEDLVYLAMIESGFNHGARSRARAVGAWQFMSFTGKRYGLKVDWWVDERRDIKKSTMAAMRYLKDLHGIFGTWELAAAAYNAGEYKIARAIQRFGADDFWTLTRQRFLKPETRNYVPKMMAAAIVAKNRVPFGFKESYLDESKSEDELEEEAETLIQKQADLQEKTEQELAETLEEYDQDYVAEGQTRPAVFVEGEHEESAAPIPVPHVDAHGKIAGQDLIELEIHSPADLLKIGRAAGLDYREVKRYNPEILRWCTPPTEDRYRIRLPAKVKDRFLAQYNHPAFPRVIHFKKVKVQRGDTLQRIARRFGLRAEPLADMNGKSEKAPLTAGVEVLLPMPSDPTRSPSSLDLKDPPRRRSRSRHRSHHRAVLPEQSSLQTVSR